MTESSLRDRVLSAVAITPVFFIFFIAFLSELGPRPIIEMLSIADYIQVATSQFYRFSQGLFSVFFVVWVFSFLLNYLQLRIRNEMLYGLIFSVVAIVIVTCLSYYMERRVIFFTSEGGVSGNLSDRVKDIQSALISVGSLTYIAVRLWQRINSTPRSKITFFDKNFDLALILILIIPITMQPMAIFYQIGQQPPAEVRSCLSDDAKMAQVFFYLERGIAIKLDNNFVFISYDCLKSVSSKK